MMRSMILKLIALNGRVEERQGHCVDGYCSNLGEDH